MDLAHFGFDRWPFQSPKPTAFQASGATHDEALARMQFLIDERRRCGLLVGASGTGKSCLFRKVSSYAERQGRCCLAIDATGIGAAEMAWQVESLLQADRDEANSPARSWSHIQQAISNLTVVGQPIAIFFDNADQALEDAPIAVCRLMNMTDNLGAEITVLLAARSALASRDLMDRVELLIDLNAWSGDETSRFVTEMLQASGAKGEIFTPEALAILQEVSQGNPRRIARMCDLSLLAAINDNRQQIDARVVEEVASELLR